MSGAMPSPCTGCVACGYGTRPCVQRDGMAPHTWILRVRGAKCPKVEMALSRKDYEGT